MRQVFFSSKLSKRDTAGQELLTESIEEEGMIIIMVLSRQYDHKDPSPLQILVYDTKDYSQLFPPPTIRNGNALSFFPILLLAPR